MKPLADVAVLLAALFSLAAPAAAQQSGPYIRLSVGAARVEAPGERFETEPAVQPSIALGYGLRGGHSAELRAGYLKAEAMERIPEGVNRDAPYTIGVRAVPLGIAYQHRLLFPGDRAYPLASVGVVWARVVDTWESDTPAESRSASVYGLDASIGLVAQLAGGASVLARGGYRSTGSAGDRYARSIGLSGSFADVGLVFRW